MIALLSYLLVLLSVLAYALLSGDPAEHAGELLDLIETALALIVPTISITNVVKGIAERIDGLSPFTGGAGAFLASWVVGSGLAGLAVALGWYEPEGPMTLAGLAGLGTLMSNLVYMRYLAGRDNTEPVTVEPPTVSRSRFDY